MRFSFGASSCTVTPRETTISPSGTGASAGVSRCDAGSSSERSRRRFLRRRCGRTTGTAATGRTAVAATRTTAGTTTGTTATTDRDDHRDRHRDDRRPGRHCRRDRRGHSDHRRTRHRRDDPRNRHRCAAGHSGPPDRGGPPRDGPPTGTARRSLRTLAGRRRDRTTGLRHGTRRRVRRASAGASADAAAGCAGCCAGVGLSVIGLIGRSTRAGARRGHRRGALELGRARRRRGCALERTTRRATLGHRRGLGDGSGAGWSASADRRRGRGLGDGRLGRRARARAREPARVRARRRPRSADPASRPDGGRGRPTARRCSTSGSSHRS